MRFGYGTITYIQNNISHNYCGYNTAFVLKLTSKITANYSYISDNIALSRICDGIDATIIYYSIVVINSQLREQDSYPGIFYGENCRITIINCLICNNSVGSCPIFGSDSETSYSVTNSQIITNSTLIHSGSGTFNEVDPATPDIKLNLLTTDQCPTGIFLFGNATDTPKKIETHDFNIRNENDKYYYAILPAIYYSS